jgi:pimeloyl-ACP methyl ester carboxylesterase
MIHGFPDFWYSWRHQMAALADRFQVVAIDQRGYNLSDKPKGVDRYDMALVAADVAAALRGSVRALGLRGDAELMFHGLDDTALNAEALSGMWNWLEKDLTLVTVPGAGHFVQQDAAELVSSTMKWSLAIH